MKEKGFRVEIPEAVLKKIFNKLSGSDEEERFVFNLGNFVPKPAHESNILSGDIIEEIGVLMWAAHFMSSNYYSMSVFIHPHSYVAEGKIRYYELALPLQYLHEHFALFRSEENKNRYIIIDTNAKPRFFIEQNPGEIPSCHIGIEPLQDAPTLGDFRKQLAQFFDFVEIAVDGFYLMFGKQTPNRKIILSYSVMTLAKSPDKSDAAPPQSDENGEKSAKARDSGSDDGAHEEKQKPPKTASDAEYKKKLRQLTEKEAALFEDIRQKVLPDLTIDDLGGQALAKERFKEILYAFTYKDVYEMFGITMSKGILFYGPPGTGKTHLAKIIARAIKATFLSIKVSDINTKWYGESEKNMSAIFRIAKIFAPTIIFFDELDTVGTSRDSDTHEVSKRVMLTFCQHLDGFDPMTDILVIGATNRKDTLDPALIRAGRFDKEVEFTYPIPDELIQIFRIHMRLVDDRRKKEKLKENLFAHIDWEHLKAHLYKKMTGGDVEQIIKRSLEKKIKIFIELTESESQENAFKKLEPITTADIVQHIKEYEKKPKPEHVIGF